MYYIVACYSYKDADSCHAGNSSSVYYQRTCYNSSIAAKLNLSMLLKNMTRKPPAEEYFE